MCIKSSTLQAKQDFGNASPSESRGDDMMELALRSVNTNSVLFCSRDGQEADTDIKLESEFSIYMPPPPLSTSCYAQHEDPAYSPLAQRCPSDSSACSKAESLIPRPRPSMARPEVESRLPKAPASPLREFLQLEKAALVVARAEQVSIREVFYQK